MSAVVNIKDISYSYDDYKLWEGDWELIDGFPFAMAPHTKTHQAVITELMYHLFSDKIEFKKCDIIPMIDYKINTFTVVRPDIVLTCGEEGENYLTKAPLIIFEIISKSTAKKDEEYKFKLYESEKVPYYVIVYPDDLIAKVFKLDGKEYDKQGDFSKEKFKFELSECEVELDFEKVFRRFRK